MPEQEVRETVSDPSSDLGRELLSWSAEPSRNHIVQFYERDEVLIEAVARYLIAGFQAGEPVVVIATEAHRLGFLKALTERGLDVEAVRDQGRLKLLDARETLATFMVDGTPDPDRFRESVGAVVESCLADGRAPRMRAYGEMVDLLWKDGNADAAVRLEELWNDLAQDYPFTLLCAYGMGTFCTGPDDASARVAALHSHVLPTESYLGADSDERLREVLNLQRRARALELEISQRKLLEQQLRETLRKLRQSEEAVVGSQQELRDFVENAVEGLHWVGPDGTILWANEAELEIVGCTREEYVGHHIAEFHADAQVIGDILDRLSRGEIIRNREARLRRKDGSLRCVTINANVFFRDGEFVHTRCFTRDVTEERQLREEREELLGRLTRTVRFSETFLGILGHDLRNPLNAITTSADLLLRRSDSKTLAKPISRILTSADRMGRMIDQILDYTRIRLGSGLLLHRKRADLKGIVEPVVEELETVHGNTPVDLAFTGSTRGCWDGDRLSQLVSNLTSNALQHRAQGSAVRVTVDGTAPDVVTLRFENEGAVPAELLPVLFEPFHGDAERKSAQSSGLGLGLYISQQVVLAHGGTIEVTSSANPGTRVTVVLPREATPRGSGVFLGLPPP